MPRESPWPIRKRRRRLPPSAKVAQISSRCCVSILAAVLIKAAVLGTVAWRPAQAHGDRRGYCPATVAREAWWLAGTAPEPLSTGKRELLPRWHGNDLLLTVDRAHVACDNLANGRRLASDSVTVGEADCGFVAFALRCQCFLRAHSGAADRRGGGRRCRSRFQRFRRCARQRRQQRFRPARQWQHRFGPARQRQHRFGPARQAGNTGSGQHGKPATPVRASTAMATPVRASTASGNTGSGQHGNAGSNASGHGSGLVAAVPSVVEPASGSGSHDGDPSSQCGHRGDAGSRCGGARCGGAGCRCGGAGPMWWRRLPMWWRRLPMWWRRLPMWWRRLPMWWRRLPMWWRPGLMSSRWLSTC